MNATGIKLGVDDYLAAGHTLLDLQQLRVRFADWEAALQAHVPNDPAGQYRARPSGLYRVRAEAHGDRTQEVEIPLTNFLAQIVGDVVEDDGAEERRRFELDARLGARRARFTLPAAQFASMNWASEHLGAGAVIFPGQSTRDHARAAIQLLSGDVPERRVLAHLGWREVDRQYVYLHAGGGIGADGPVAGLDVRAPDRLAHFVLPAPPVGDERVLAVRASLRLLRLAPLRITVPALAAVYRAVLGTADSSVHFAGGTGRFKSELAALQQQHYGAGMDRLNLPANWSSTPNTLEALAFAAKDVLLVVDDFAPTGDRLTAQRLHAAADRVLRAQGNASARQRMQQNGTLVPARPPRGLIISTGEDVPNGESVRARALIVEVGPNDIDPSTLTACQADAAAGRYAAALAGYVHWLAPQYASLRTGLRQEVATLRTQAPSGAGHRRTADVVASLALGWRYFLTYARAVGAITTDEEATCWRSGWAALQDAGAQQAQHQMATEPTRRFLELLVGALASGRAHVAGSDGQVPSLPEAWGWRLVKVGIGDFQRGEWQPQGTRIGWLADEALFLEPVASYGIAQRLARESEDGLAVSRRTLHKRLHEQALLVTTEHERGTFAVRRMLQGQRRNVLHLAADSLMVQEPAQPAQAAYPEPAPPSPNGEGDLDGQDMWAGSLVEPTRTCPESLPRFPSSELGAHANGQIGRVGQVEKRKHKLSAGPAREVYEL